MNNKIFFENIRNKYFKNNFGPKIENELRKNIIAAIKNFIPYNNEFLILFLFSFPASELFEYKNYDKEKEFVYLLKFNDIIYILYRDQCFEIDLEKKLLALCDFPDIKLLNIKKSISYNKNEFAFSSMEDIYDNPLIYLYKIYYLGEELSIKK